MSVIPASPDPTLQYLRACTLLVSTAQGKALDLSALRIKFSVKRSNAMTPNVADIRVYNLSQQTALEVQKQYTRVVLQAGYQGNYGVIFAGTIKQVIIGRESATDTFIEIVAGDGDLAYNFAVVNTTLAKGSTPQMQVDAAVSAMTPLGTTAGGNTKVPATTALPRGKVLYGNARTYLRSVGQSVGSNWSIQNEKVVFVPKASYLPGTAVVINSQTGQIGTPQQTLQGVNVKTLLNPNIQIATRVQLDNKSIQRLPVNLNTPGSASSIPAPLTTDGVYFVLIVDHTGDTRGIEWYSSLVCIYIDPTLPGIQSAVGVPFV